MESKLASPSASSMLVGCLKITCRIVLVALDINTILNNKNKLTRCEN